MVYLSSFLLSERKVKNPNLYPYSVFQNKYLEPFIFTPITILYGNNGSGKSTMLNIIAKTLNIAGYDEYAYGKEIMNQFVAECSYGMADDDFGRTCKIPKNSRYIKSEDILYEVKKIQQEDALKQGYVYEQVRRGSSKEQAEQELYSFVSGYQRMNIIKFAQEKYSNGETAMQLLLDGMEPDAIYLLDEPEVSLSPQNQVKLAEKINEMVRFLDCQFIIATHSPFMLGTLEAKIYNLDSNDMNESKWYQLENVRYFYDFFKKNEKKFL